MMKMSGSYDELDFVPAPCRVIDLRDLDGTCCYCDRDSLDALRRAAGPFSPETVHWIDSGDFHYLSLVWMEKIDRPFALLLLDNHSDDQPVAFDENLLSCGSWVKVARETLPMLRHVCHVRERGDAVDLPQGLPVYVSLDKDVMSREYARTDWDQGDLSLEEVMAVISSAAASHELIGVDVCGETSSSKGGCGEDVEINLRTNKKIAELLLTLAD